MSQGSGSKTKPKRKEDRLAEQRRRFLALLATAGGVATAASLAPWTEFLLSSIIKGGEETRQQIRLPDSRIASIANTPINTAATFVYPRTGDPVADAEPFRRFQLIRLSKENGGEASDPSALRAYSMICVHLWCLWDYKPERVPEGEDTLGSIECPCHGSKYRPIDGLAVAGPAFLQTAPNNALARLSLEVDDDGQIWVLPPVWNVNDNGVVGFGRYIER